MTVRGGGVVVVVVVYLDENLVTYSVYCWPRKTDEFQFKNREIGADAYGAARLNIYRKY